MRRTRPLTHNQRMMEDDASRLCICEIWQRNEDVECPELSPIKSTLQSCPTRAYQFGVVTSRLLLFAGHKGFDLHQKQFRAQNACMYIRDALGVDHSMQCSVN